MRHRREERGASPVVAGQATGPGRLDDQAVPRQQGGGVRGERAHETLFVGGQDRPDEDQLGLVVDGLSHARVGDVGQTEVPGRGHQRSTGREPSRRETRAAARIPNVVRARSRSAGSGSASARSDWASAARTRDSRCARSATSRRRAARWTTEATAAATTTNTTSATAFCGLWIVNVPFGSVKNQLMAREDTTAQKIAGSSPPTSAVADGEREEQQHLERQLVPAGRARPARA